MFCEWVSLETAFCFLFAADPVKFDLLAIFVNINKITPEK